MSTCVALEGTTCPRSFVVLWLATEPCGPTVSVHFVPTITFFEPARWTSAAVTVRVHVPSIGDGGAAADAGTARTSAAAAAVRTAIMRANLCRQRQSAVMPPG